MTIDDTILSARDIRRRMKCNGVVAHNIEEAFVTVEQLLDAIESDRPLTDCNGIGPKTADVIEDWYEHREEREANVGPGSIERTSSRSATIHIHTSWEGALGLGGDGGAE